MDGSFEVVEKTREPHVRTRYRNSSKKRSKIVIRSSDLHSRKSRHAEAASFWCDKGQSCSMPTRRYYEQEADGVKRMCLACIIDLFASGVELTILSNRSK